MNIILYYIEVAPSPFHMPEQTRKPLKLKKFQIPQSSQFTVFHDGMRTC